MNVRLHINPQSLLEQQTLSGCILFMQCRIWRCEGALYCKSHFFAPVHSAFCRQNSWRHVANVMEMQAKHSDSGTLLELYQEM